MRHTQLRGHGLLGEGIAWEELEAGYWAIPYERFVGRGRCSCGATSLVLRSNAARRRWHNSHKDAIRAGAPKDAD